MTYEGGQASGENVSQPLASAPPYRALRNEGTLRGSSGATPRAARLPGRANASAAGMIAGSSGFDAPSTERRVAGPMFACLSMGAQYNATLPTPSNVLLLWSVALIVVRRPGCKYAVLMVISELNLIGWTFVATIESRAALGSAVRSPTGREARAVAVE
jgi:hypothetical protein